MCATCGKQLWCAAIALDLHNKVSHLTFQKKTHTLPPFKIHLISETQVQSNTPQQILNT